MEKHVNASSYEATDSSRKSTHVYATLSEDKYTDCRSTNQNGSSNGEYTGTYADTTNVDYITKQQNGDRTSSVNRKVLIVISFIVGVVVGMAITSAGYLIVKTMKTSATDDHLIEEIPNGNVLKM
jgi:capsular polysaccharide biosynthesis protein